MKNNTPNPLTALVIAAFSFGVLATQANAAAVTVPVERNDREEVSTATLVCYRNFLGGTTASVQLRFTNRTIIEGASVSFTLRGGLPREVNERIDGVPYEVSTRFFRGSDRVYVRGAFLGSEGGDTSLRFELPDNLSVACD